MVDTEEAVKTKEKIAPPLELYDAQLSTHSEDEVVDLSGGFYLLKNQLPSNLDRKSTWHYFLSTKGVVRPFKIEDKYLSLVPRTFESGPRYVELRGGERIKVGGNWSPQKLVIQMQDKKISRVVAAKHPVGTASWYILGEARRLAQFQHPNIAIIYDIAVTDDVKDWSNIYIIMEWLDGGTLEQWMIADRSLEDIVHVIDGIASGVTHINDGGFVYADLKSDNVVFDSNGTPKIIDVEISREMDENGIAKGNGDGAIDYTPPEQRDGHLSLAADEYAFAAVIFRMLSIIDPNDFGQNKWERDKFVKGDDDEFKLRDNVTKEFESKPELLQQLKQVLKKALDKDPNNRYHSVQELNTELQTIFKALKRA